MTRLRMMLSSASAALALSLSTAMAGPTGIVGAGAMPDSDLVLKTHGFHRHCAMGPFGLHRHHPVYGRIPCGPPAYVPPPPVYVPPPPRFVPPPPPRPNRCAFVFNRCASAYPQGSPAFFGCMRSRGC